MRVRLRTVLPVLLAIGVSQPALSQRVVKTKDAPAPLPVTPEPPPPPPTPAPQAAPAAATPAPTPRPPGTLPPPPKIALPPKWVGDAGPQYFKDDLTADDLKRSQGALPDKDCAHGGCEALIRKRIGLLQYVLHVRPSSPVPGDVAELVVDVAEVLEPPDPDLGDRRPLEKQQLTAKVEGLGVYQLHSPGGNVGSYGFHMTPPSKGVREVEIRIEGRTEAGPIFRVNIGGEQKVTAKGETLELRPYEYRPGNGDTARNMYELGITWGQLWTLALGGKGDQAALTKMYAQLAKQGTTLPLPKRADRALYEELSGKLAATGEAAVALKPGGLRDFMTTTQSQQCNRCHVVYDYHLTDDVSLWPNFTVGGGAQ
jgi:hypothetical protein